MRAPEWLLRIRDLRYWRKASVAHLRRAVAHVRGQNAGLQVLFDVQGAQIESLVGQARAAEVDGGHLEARILRLEGTVADAKDGRRIERLEYHQGASSDLLEELSRLCSQLSEQVRNLEGRICDTEQGVRRIT